MNEQMLETGAKPGVEEALSTVLRHVPPPAVKRVALPDALGSVLASSAIPRIPLPPFDTSAMDGFALRARETHRADRHHPMTFRIVGEVSAGDHPSFEVGPGEAARIATGAPIPNGADAVLMLEWSKAINGHVRALKAIHPMENIRNRGEDVSGGGAVLETGTLLGSGELALLAAVGLDAVDVFAS
ncbi:MAG: MoeA family protein, partial [Planctomycetota bacterium]